MLIYAAIYIIIGEQCMASADQLAPLGMHGASLEGPEVAWYIIPMVPSVASCYSHSYVYFVMALCMGWGGGETASQHKCSL